MARKRRIRAPNTSDEDVENGIVPGGVPREIMSCDESLPPHSATLIVKEGGRIDRVLVNLLNAAEKDHGAPITRSRVQRGIMASCVELNGTVVTKVGQKCRSKDILTYRDAVRGVEWVKAEDIPLEFLYEDKHLMVINKPAGMVCHPSGSLRSGTLLNALLHHMGTGPIDPSIVEESFPKDVDAPEPEELLETSASSPPIPFPGYDGTEKPGIVHRLDKGTTGVMVVAKNEACHAALMKQFTERSTGRVYHAMVLGVPEEPEGELTTRIGPAREQSCMAVVGEEREGRVAITGYRVLESLHGGSLVEFRLKTGRTHQIRVHASHLGHPLIGDATYSTQAQTEACPQGVCLARPALHATSLAFNHPHSNERMLFEAPLPPDMAAAAATMRTGRARN